METSVLVGTPAKQGSSKSRTPSKELLAAARDGSVHDVEVALAALKKINGNIDTRNSFGSTALHIAVWRNHVPIVKRLLAAGANADARDGESGWTSLHRAFHFGHLAVSGVLIEAGASLTVEDTRGRVPVDMISGPVQQSIRGSKGGESATEVYSWGNGFNYQLGTGTSGIQRKPCRVDTLGGLDVKSVAAAKFHSVALTASGDVYSWGFGRGGRLGHPDFDIHSGQVAVITPQQVISGLGARRVTAIAAAKHHTIVATDNGEVYTWGSNREGQLGYPAVDTQPTPRRVSTLKARVVKVAAANKHSAVVTETGEVLTWGCNTEGQLGYGTSNSSYNCAPRCVDYLKGKKMTSISASKYHTVVLGSEGEVYTWGYKMVTPRRVQISRNTKKSGLVPLKFHRVERLHIVAIAAGTTHTSAISEDGTVFYWSSGDQNLKSYQLFAMSGRQAVAVAAGKYRTSVVTGDGSVFIWDGEDNNGEPPAPMRVHGIKHATALSVGENHSLVVASLFVPVYPPEPMVESKSAHQAGEESGEDTDFCEEFEFLPEVPVNKVAPVVPSLKELCQEVVIESMVEPKNVLHVFEIAEALEAEKLRSFCEDMLLHNLSYVLTMSSSVFGQLRPALLAELEKSLDASSMHAWSHRRLPTHTATLPAVVDSEEESCDISARVRGMLPHNPSGLSPEDVRVSEEVNHLASVADEDIQKQMRAVRKKLQQIEGLELKLSKGQTLDSQQYAKLQTKQDLEEALASLESGVFPRLIQKQKETGDIKPAENISQPKTGASQSHQKASKKKPKKLTLPSKGDENVSTPVTSVVQPEMPSVGTEDIPPSDNWCEAKARLQSASQHARGGMDTFDNHRSTNLLDFSPEFMHQFPRTVTGLAATKKKAKKGGLSMFLSGALEAPPKQIVARADGPVWGGAKAAKVSSSLLEIQTTQTAESAVEAAVQSPITPKYSQPVKGVKSGGLNRIGSSDNLHEELKGGNKRVQWTPFVRASEPIAVVPAPATPKSLLESSPPPWSGASPGQSVRPLRDIQLEQRKHKGSQRSSNPWGSPQSVSPFGSTHGASSGFVVNADHSAGTSIENPNRWYKPDEESPSSLRCIQIEEEAMKELRRVYKNVKLVKLDTSEAARSAKLR